MKRDADGGLTLHIQHDSPGKENESNWLPAPSETFHMFMRLYWPKLEALDARGRRGSSRPCGGSNQMIFRRGPGAPDQFCRLVSIFSFADSHWLIPQHNRLDVSS